MKTAIIILVLVVGFSLIGCSQKAAPENVKKEFSQKFPAAKSIKWDSEKTNEWEAEFTLDGKEMSACFDNAGKWLESETEISSKDVPPAVTAALAKDFPAYKIDEISFIENSELKGYETALKNKKDKLTVVFSLDGTVIKKETEAEAGDKEIKEKSGKEADEEGEEKEAPAIIRNAFRGQFPGAKKVEWGSESVNEWEAEFTLDGKKMSACYDSTAKWIDSETVISEKELPAAVINAINSQFKGYKTKLIEIYDSPEMKGFEIELKKGESSLEIILDNTGKILKKSDLKDEEKEEK